MATYLDLCRMVERESGTVNRAQRIADVVAPPTDRQEKVVNWVRQAWYLIQVSRGDWTFHIGDVQATLASGVSSYTPAALGIQRFGDWVVDTDEYRPWTVTDPALPLVEAEIVGISYEVYRSRYGRGAQQLQRPTEYAIGRNREFCVGSMPDRPYVLRGEYRKTPQQLATNSEPPDLPEQYHDAIAWRALMLLGEHDEAPLQIGTAQAKFAPLYQRMVNELTPRVALATATGYFS